MTDEHAQIKPAEVGFVSRRFWWLKRIAVVVAIVLVALGGLRWGWGRQAHARLQAEIDRYRAAGQPVYPDDFLPPRVPYPQNGALALRQAARALPRSADKRNDALNDLVGRPDVIRRRGDQVRKILEASAKSRALVRRARNMPGTDWEVTLRSPVVHTLLRHLAPQRRLAKLLSVAAIYHHHNDDDAEAIETVRDILVQARHMDEQPFLISHLVALSMGGKAVRAVEGLAPDLAISDRRPSSARALPRHASRHQVQALVAELLDEDGLRRNWIRALYGERMMQLDTAQWVTDGKAGPTFMSTGEPQPPGPLRRAVTFTFRPLYLLDSLRIIRQATAGAEAAKAPTLPGCLARWPPVPAAAPFEGVFRPLSRTLVFSFDRAVQLHYRGLGVRRLAAVALAIRLYELDHGRRPKTLDELIPQYLPAVPDDPYAPDKRKVGYRPEADRPVLYCVGLDGVDEQGAFDVDPKGEVDEKAKDLPFFLNGDRHGLAPTDNTTQPTSSGTDGR